MKRRDFIKVGAVAAAVCAVVSEKSEAQMAPWLFEWEEATIGDLREAMARGKVTAVGITKHYLRRIQEIDKRGPKLNAVIEVNPDVLAIAEELDKERKAKGPTGPLHGIPVLIKDNIATRDKMRTTAGSLALAGAAPPEDSFVAKRLRAAGAVILGKTNLSEWANIRSTRSTSGWSGRGGLTLNPYALDRNCSGSSSGSGAAISANLCAVAVGTETDGSIVSPSSLCGVVGLKPTVGLVSRFGIVPISHTQDTAGPMTRSVTDAAILLGALAGTDANDPATAEASLKMAEDYTKFLDTGALKGARLGVARKFFGISDAIDKMMAEAMAVMKGSGAELIDPADIPTHGKYGENEDLVLSYELKADLNKYLAWLGATAPVHSLAEIIEFNERNKTREMPWFGQEFFLSAEKRGPLTEVKYLDALAKNHRLAREEGIDAVMNEHKLDAIIAPTSGPAPVTDLVYGDRDTSCCSTPAAVAGYPHITLPMGTVNGLPIGISFFGRAWSEGKLLGLAYAFEQLTNARRAPKFLATVADSSKVGIRKLVSSGEFVFMLAGAITFTMIRNRYFVWLVSVFFSAAAIGSRADDNFAAVNDVTWTSLGTNENDSMPLGNGDVAVNVWTEQNGDIVLLVAKADAWSENGQLMKLGRVRVKLTPNPFTNAWDFTQTLRMESGDVLLEAGNNKARIWVDANHAVVHVDTRTEEPVEISATPETWRTTTYHSDAKAVGRAGFFEWGNNPDGLTFHPDTTTSPDSGLKGLYHYNTNSIYPLVFEKEHLESLLPKYRDPLLHRCFGLAVSGGNDGATLSPRVDIFALTETDTTPQRWEASMKDWIGLTESQDIAALREAHKDWWQDFWNRSWVHVTGEQDAVAVSQGYAIQRFMSACAGRGAQPMKFNGSLFTVGHDLSEGRTSTPEKHDPDFRQWGNSYWNQNTRHLYWPMLAAGDYDELMPWFNMYVHDLPLATDRTKLYFHHNGAAFIETMYFWGLPNVNDFGWNNPGPELESTWMKYHIQGGLEVLEQMLDYYDDIGDAEFARTRIAPLAEGLVKFYDEHWKRGPDGKIRMAPWQAIETYQRDAVNPTPDVAGLKSVLPRLLSLPETSTKAQQRNLWKKVLGDLPPVPIGTATAKGKTPPRGQGDPQGKRILLPAEKYGEQSNHENPELYAVFPYPLYGVGKPDLEMAQDTFRARANPFGRCWGQDGIHAALLGLTDDARKSAVEAFTQYGQQHFRWFWKANSDWIPDMDNGGAGSMTVQDMLMQSDGKRILLLPAWPKDWTADFKLHAPYQTIVEGRVERGHVTGLKVTPQEREKDVVLPN